MAEIPASHADLVGAPHFAHLATLNPDGSPQASVIWVRRDPASPTETVLFYTQTDFQKTRNMERDPRVSLTIHDQADPYRSLELRGTATVTPVADGALLHALARDYWGTDFPDPIPPGLSAEVRITVTHARVTP